MFNSDKKLYQELDPELDQELDWQLIQGSEGRPEEGPSELTDVLTPVYLQGPLELTEVLTPEYLRGPSELTEVVDPRVYIQEPGNEPQLQTDGHIQKPIEYNENNFDRALQAFFDNSLKPGMAWSDDTLKTLIGDKIDGELVYQDGVSSPWFYALSDVYKLEDGTYIVKTNWQETDYLGDCLKDHANLAIQKCNNLEAVLKELYKFCEDEPNSTGKMLHIMTSVFLSRDEYYNYVVTQKKSPIEIIKENPELINKMYKESLNGAWIFHKDAFGIKFDQYLTDQFTKQ